VAEDTERGRTHGTPWTPVPDPTYLTTAQLLREVEAAKELLSSGHEATQQLLELSIEDLKEVLDEKFEKVEQQFELVERQRVEQKKDTKDAVDAALTAQKEAVREQTAASERAIAKSEAATSKQLDQLSVTFTTEASSLRREMGEQKERLTTIEQRKVGGSEQRTEQRQSLAGVYAAIGALGIVFFVVLAIVGLIASNSP